MANEKTLTLSADIVTLAIKNKYGCTLILDNNISPLELSGMYLDKPTDDINLVAGMAHIDGAVQINSDGAAIAFGCILDGQRLSNEVLSRGARYNSARRFSKETAASKIAIVAVSADGPVTIFNQGVEIYSDPWARPIKLSEPFGPVLSGEQLN